MGPPPSASCGPPTTSTSCGGYRARSSVRCMRSAGLDARMRTRTGDHENRAPDNRAPRAEENPMTAPADDAVPDVVLRAVDAAERHDTDAFLACFASDGVVDDWGRRFTGA